MDLATTVSQRRRAVGLTQRDLADLSGVSERFVRELEGGKQTVQWDKAVAVLSTMGLELTTRPRP